MKFRNSNRKSQTATEYLIIVAIVIVIALVVVQSMGGFPGLGSSSSKKVSDYKLSSGDKVGISNYYFGEGYVLATLKSNYYDTLQIINVTIRNVSCTINNTNISGTNSSAFILTLSSGQSSTINCTGPFNISFNDAASPYFLANYIDSLTNTYMTASYSGIGGSDSNVGSGGSGGSGGESSFPCNNSATFHNGTGTISDPYGICNWAQLNNLRNNLTANYVLLSNLSSNSLNYSGIGNNWTPTGFTFSGNFEGNNNTISNLIINLPSNNYIGLFGYDIGNISNLGLIAVNITGYNYVGGLVGYSRNQTIKNSYTTGIIKGNYGVGGIVGLNIIGLTMINCSSSAQLIGDPQVPQLVGIGGPAYNPIIPPVLKFSAGESLYFSWPYSNPRHENAGVGSEKGWGFAAMGAKTGTSWLNSDLISVGDFPNTYFVHLYTDNRWHKVGQTGVPLDFSFTSGRSWNYQARQAVNLTIDEIN